MGLRSTRAGAYGIAPDYAIAVDVTVTGDTPEGRKMDVSLGDVEGTIKLLLSVCKKRLF